MKRNLTARSGILILSGLSLIAPLSGGCKSKNPMPTTDGDVIANPPVSVSQPQPANNQAAQEAIVVSLVADQSTYRRGETLNFTITARNSSDAAQRLVFASGQRFDIVVTPEGDAKEPGWRWSTGKVFTMIFGNVSWRPGETKTWTATWDQTAEERALPRGRYVVQAELASTPRLKSKPLTITLAD
jgi:hypothetical protein